MLSSSLRWDDIGYSPMLTYMDMYMYLYPEGRDVIVGQVLSLHHWSPIRSLYTEYTYPEYSHM
jgi:hypothetical protein